ncbi:hypothetical protein [Brevibacterium sp. Marseille-P9724]|uniref:hypothetical protein n=1 Tax=Brevibacterium sp. Marseille-P9724 TaxID=2614125 RepID=UPI00125FAABB|nr:hypothetical protein [Brevibacterium sp. Marseille-P9724]
MSRESVLLSPVPLEQQAALLNIEHLMAGGHAIQFEAPGTVTIIDKHGEVLLTVGLSRRIETDEDALALLDCGDDERDLTGMYWTDLLFFKHTEMKGRLVATTMAKAIDGYVRERL